MSARVITITREFGSGGRTIGRMVADALGYDFYDWNLVVKIAEESGFAQSFVDENSEDANSRMPWLFKMQSYGTDLSDQLFLAQRKVILELAEKGNCVIVGRCADYILRDEPGVLNCFIYAEEHFKRDRIITEYGEQEESIEKRMKKKDSRRKAHYQFYTGRKWGLSFYYDLCMDSGRLGIENCASIITSLARRFEGVPKQEEE